MRRRKRTSQPRQFGRSLRLRYSPEWMLRGGLAVVLILFAVPALTATLANVVRKPSPRSAYILASADGRTAAALAARSFSEAPNPRRDSEQAALALRALRLDPTAVDALNVLAMQAEMRQDQAVADRLFAYSFALSRRELQPQIWTIEKAVEKGDINKAIENYDLALRTSRGAQKTLFPVLASALVEPKVRDAVLSLLESKPVWAEAFLDFASSRGRHPKAVAKLLYDGGARLPVTGVHRAHLVSGLAAEGFIEEAWNFFTTFRPGVSRIRSRNPSFLQLDAPTMFDWRVGNASGLSVALVQGREKGYLEFSMPPSMRAVVVSQVQVLPPGTYKLDGISAGIDQPDLSLPYWSLACRGGAELGRVNVPKSDHNGGKFSGHFNVPSNCPVQTLSLVARSSNKASGVFGQFEWLQINPADE